MSLLDLSYLEEPQADTAISAVHQWCAENGCNIADANGKKAMATAFRLSKATEDSGPNLFHALDEEMAASSQLSRTNTVLIVEDEPLIAMEMETILQAEGIVVECCVSREDTLRLLQSRTPIAAILDFQLKDGETRDIAAELRARDVPVIFCSGLHRDDIPHELRGATWIFKPFDDRQLVATVAEALEMRDFRQELEESA